MQKLALTRVSTDDLETVLKLIYHDEMVCPLDRKAFFARGLNNFAEYGGILHGLSKQAASVVLVAVIAERRCLGTAAS